MALDILIIDDETDIRELISGILEDEGYATRMATDSDSALNEITARLPSLIFLDIWMQGSRLDGLQLLDKLHSEHPALPIVIISGHGNLETAVSAIKRGAYDYIEKPFNMDRLLLITQRALEASTLRREVADLKEKSGDDLNELIGDSTAIGMARSLIERSAPTNSRVMLFGGSGTGKSLCARLLHENSARANGPFIDVNLSLFDPTTLERELFGYEANTQQGLLVTPGALEKAHGGTLYLAAVDTMPLTMQTQFLRALVNNRFTRTNGETEVKVDFRLVSGTAVNFQPLIDGDAFRSDLFHRLNVVPIQLPSLKDRREDIPYLAEHFIQLICRQNTMPPHTISPEAMAVLQTQNWPGNARQLRNSIERLIILVRDNLPTGGEITAEMFPADIGEVLPAIDDETGTVHMMSLPLRQAREVFERQYLLAQIERFGGNISKTAAFVGMERSALHRKLKSLGL